MLVIGIGCDTATEFRELGIKMSDFSSFLFARPSLIEGAGRILDFGDTLTEYNRSPTGEIADYIALATDWKQVGGDLFAVIGNEAGEQPIETE